MIVNALGSGGGGHGNGMAGSSSNVLVKCANADEKRFIGTLAVTGRTAVRVARSCQNDNT